MIPWNKGKKGTKKTNQQKETIRKIAIEKGYGKWMLGKRLSEETKKKIGEKSKGHKGGGGRPKIKDRTKLKTDRNKSYDTQYKYWMLEVKKRDGWKCKINNEDCYGRLEAHHILPWKDFPELRYNINNGITLCQFHHPRKRDDEIKLIPTFQKLVEVK